MASAHLLAILRVDDDGRFTDEAPHVGLYGSRHITHNLRHTILAEIMSAEGDSFQDAAEKLLERLRADPVLSWLAAQIEEEWRKSRDDVEKAVAGRYEILDRLS